MNLRRTLLVLGTLVATFGATVAMANDGTAGSGNVYGPISAAFAIAIAVLGGSIGQGKTAAAALEGISRNPAAQGKIFVPMIIGLALIESLVLYAFVIALVKT